MSENGVTVAVAPLDRLCLRLDNGTRIGHSKVLDADRDADVIKLEFTEGVLKGIVSDDDLTRISEIAGRLDAQKRAAATAPTARPQAAAQKDNTKRKRVHKPQMEIPDVWADKGMRVLDKLANESTYSWFAEPVRPTPTFAPDYFQVVSQPMDLSIVKDKLRSGQYANVQEFESELELIWNNAVLYNGEKQDVGAAALRLKSIAQKEMQRLGLTGTAGGDRNKRANAGTASQRFDDQPEMSTDSRQRSRGGGAATSKPPGTTAHSQQAKAAPKPRKPRPPTWAQAKDTVVSALEQVLGDEGDAYGALLPRVEAVCAEFADNESELDVEMITPEAGMALYHIFVEAQIIAPVAGGAPAPAAPQGPRANVALDEDATESE